MTKEKYENYWNNHFYGLAITLEQKNAGITFNSKSKDDIYEAYERYRIGYKKNYGFKADEKIDRHKIASLIVCAIITQSNIFKINLPETPLRARLVPIEWAIRCGLAVILDFSLQKLKKNGTKAHDIEIFKKLDFCFPAASEGHYLFHLTKSIYNCAHKKKASIEKLIDSLPHIFFFLEKEHMDTFHLKTRR